MYRAFGKRAFDAAASALGVALCLPFFLVIPVAIRLESGGPVFFRQARMGRGGRPFTLLKFRSMTVDADKEKKGFEPGAALRVTAVGALLRKTKLDELPQLLNVLAGDMSFVGPRPEVERYKDFYAGRFSDVLSVRPGITDEASIKYRHEEALLAESADPERTYREAVLPDKLELALRYAREGVTFSGDLGIIFRTLLTVLR